MLRDDDDLLANLAVVRRIQTLFYHVPIFPNHCRETVPSSIDCCPTRYGAVASTPYLSEAHAI